MLNMSKEKKRLRGYRLKQLCFTHPALSFKTNQGFVDSKVRSKQGSLLSQQKNKTSYQKRGDVVLDKIKKKVSALPLTLTSDRHETLSIKTTVQSYSCNTWYVFLGLVLVFLGSCLCLNSTSSLLGVLYVDSLMLDTVAGIVLILIGIFCMLTQFKLEDEN